MGEKRNKEAGKQRLAEVFRDYLIAEEVLAFGFEATWLDWFPAPRKQGKYSHHYYGQVGNTNHGRLPRSLRPMAQRLSLLSPRQRFTNATLCQFEEGDFMKPRRAPLNVVGYMITAVFGSFEGGELVIGKAKRRLALREGDVVVQRCRVGDLPRPLYRLTPITKGTRYTFNLTTME